MTRERLSMRKVREVLRLKFASGFSDRKIARSCGIGRSTVADYLRRAESAQLSWPLAEGVDDAALERLLFAPVPVIVAARRPVLDDGVQQGQRPHLMTLQGAHRRWRASRHKG